MNKTQRDNKGQFIVGHSFNLGKHYTWGSKEIKLLRNMYSTTDINKLAYSLNRRPATVKAYANKLGLKRDAQTASRARSLAAKQRPKRKLDKQHRKKISQGLKRYYATHDGVWKGKKHTAEHKEKIRAATKGRINLGNKNPAKRLSVRKKIAATLRQGASSFFDFKDHPEWRRKNLKSCMKKPTRPEQFFIQLCQQRLWPFRYVGNGEKIIGTLNPDFISTNHQKKIVEIFGRVFHDPEVSFKDNIPQLQQEAGRCKYYSQLGYDCLIIWDDEIYDKEGVVSKVTSFLSE